jgi:hypothetical protein
MMTTADLLEGLYAHLATFELPPLCSVNLTQGFSGATVSAQLAHHTPPQTRSWGKWQNEQLSLLPFHYSHFFSLAFPRVSD